MTDLTFNQLEVQMREVLTAMEKAVESEWQEYANKLCADFAFSGDDEEKFKQLENLGATMRLEAAEQMSRNKGTWTGQSAVVNNTAEAVRHDAAQRVFESRYSTMLHRAFTSQKKA